MEVVRPSATVPRSVVAAPLLAILALLGAIAFIVVLFGETARGCGAVGGVSGHVPRRYAPVYVAAASRYKLGLRGPAVLAAIHKVETGFGTNLNVSSAGALGHMQFLPSTWSAYAVDGDGDGQTDPYDAADAIFSAAHYLRASGAPGDWRAAIFAYNHAGWYVDEVLSLARRFAGPGWSTEPLGCTPGAGSGDVKILPGADRSGVPIAPVTLKYLRSVAGIAGVELRVGTGSNHSQLTTSGTISDHWDGHAADIPMSAYGKPDADPLGDRIMAACLIAGGTAPARAQTEAERGGLYTLYHRGLRIQCIWKTYEGGDHYNHVHIGARSA
jgi:Transglycosylase SLT domain